MLTVSPRGLALCAAAVFVLSSCHAQDGGLDTGRDYNVCLFKGFKTGAGGMRLPVWRPYVLLKDGSAYENPNSPPELLDASSSRQSEPARWGSWTRQGNEVTLNIASHQPMSTTHCISPAPAGTTLDGSYKHVGGGGTLAAGGHASFMRSDRYRFNADGSFDSGRSSGLISPGASSVSESARSGHYQIHDYSIELRYDDGSQATLFFYSDGRQLLHLGEDDYVPATD